MSLCQGWILLHVGSDFPRTWEWDQHPKNVRKKPLKCPWEENGLLLRRKEKCLLPFPGWQGSIGYTGCPGDPVSVSQRAAWEPWAGHGDLLAMSAGHTSQAGHLQDAWSWAVPWNSSVEPARAWPVHTALRRTQWLDLVTS